MYQQRPAGNQQQYLTMEQLEQQKVGGQRANANLYPGLQGAQNAGIRSPTQGYMLGTTNEKNQQRK